MDGARAKVRGFRKGLCGLGLAAALIAVGPVGAARADTGPVDVSVKLGLAHPQVAPGNFIDLDAIIQVKTGTVSTLNMLLHLPEGLDFVADNPPPGSQPLCAAVSADGRDVKCRGYLPGQFGETGVRVRAAKSVPAGTRLTVTETADIGDAVDVHPQDNTASLSILVKPGADWALAWSGPSKPVAPGSDVTLRLVARNHGEDPGTASVFVEHVSTLWPYLRPFGPNPYNCGPATDGDLEECRIGKSVAPGRSVTVTFHYKVLAAAAGHTLPLSGSVYPGDVATEPNLADNKAAFTLKFATATATASPTPTPTSTVPASPAPTGPSLAATGSGSTTPLLLTAAGLGTAGAAALLLTARRRRRGSTGA